MVKKWLDRERRHKLLVWFALAWAFGAIPVWALVLNLGTSWTTALLVISIAPLVVGAGLVALVVLVAPGLAKTTGERLIALPIVALGLAALAGWWVALSYGVAVLGFWLADGAWRRRSLGK